MDSLHIPIICSLTDAVLPADVSQPWPISKRDDAVCLTKWVNVQFAAPDIYIYLLYNGISN